MGAWYDEIPNDDILKWMLDQKLWFVASAPLSGKGHVNLSPRGRTPINIVGKNACWFPDMTGSGNETISHIYEKGNARVTLMFIAFEGPPRIVRLFCKGKVFERASPEFDELLPEGDERAMPGTRAIIWLDIHKVATSCGYTVPYFSYEGERLLLDEYYQKVEDRSPVDEEAKLPTELIKNWTWINKHSIDGLPGLKSAKDPNTKPLAHAFEVYDTETGEEIGHAVSRKEKEVGVKQEVKSAPSQWLVFAVGLAAGLAVAAAVSRTEHLINHPTI